MKRLLLRRLILLCAVGLLSHTIHADEATNQEKLNAALCLAVEEGYPFKVSRLLSAGASVKAADSFMGSPPLILACRYRRIDEVQQYDPATGTWRLVKVKHQREYDTERGLSRDPYDTTEEHLLIIELLLSYGADIEVRDPFFGQTPLIEAAMAGNRRCVEFLLEHGARIEARGTGRSEGDTALKCAVSNHPDIARVLLQHGAKVNAQDIHGTSALIIAAAHQNASVELLLSYGAKVNVKGNRGLTPLINAARFGCTDNARLLLKHGAQVNARKTDGTTALMYAAGAGDHRFPQYDPEKQNFAFVEWKGPYGNKDLVALLLAKGAKINARDKQGHTALHYANDPAIIRLLKRHGAKQ